MKAIKYLSCILIAFQSTSSQVISWERVAAPNHLISDMLFISNGNLIAGTLTAGIFISTNKGISWFPSNQGLSSNNIYAVEKTPSETIFIGTGGDGVYRSTNQGQSWEFFGLYNKYINTITILNDSEIFVGTFGESVFYSSDRGNTWIERGNGIYFPVIIKMTANDSGVVFLCTDTGRMYRTTDKGLEWVEINNGLPYSTANSLIIDYSRILYAGNNEGLFISGNNGDIWIKRING